MLRILHEINRKVVRCLKNAFSSKLIGEDHATVIMSTRVDYTITRVSQVRGDNPNQRESSLESTAEDAPGENSSGTVSENSDANRSSQDSGVALNFSESLRDSGGNNDPSSQDSAVGLNFSPGFRKAVVEETNSQDLGGSGLNFSAGFCNSLKKPPHAASSGPTPSGLNLSHRRNGGQANLGTPLSDLRRPSIVDMVNKGGVFITQGGTCEINLDNMDANDLEQFYAEAHAGQRRGSCLAPNLAYSGKEMEDLCESSWMHKHSASGSSEHLSLHSDKFQCLNTSKYWWSPKFNSEVLETQLKKTVVEFLRRRFRLALVFVGMCTLLWIVVFSVNIPFSPSTDRALSTKRLEDNLAVYSVRYNPSYVFGGLVLFVCTTVLLVITFTHYYGKFARSLSILFAVILMLASFSLAISQKFSGVEGVQGFLTLSFVAQFALTAVSILVIFTLSHLPIWLSVALSVIYLIILEGLVGFSTYGQDTFSTLPNQNGTTSSQATPQTTTSSPAESISNAVYINSAIGRIVLYIGLIAANLTTSYLLQVRQLATFWKIAQCVLSQKALDLERDLEEKTILSMMPKNFADSLLNIHVQMAFMLKQSLVQEGQENLDPQYQSITAPFNICNMDNVSILFADIVDFTKFSSTLSAAELVGILNDVFSTFDELVMKHKCEKISTLGDCYFCVSGCPEPESKHADNCVNMGLAIIEALEDYRKRTKRPIKMRVGIHTGSVFCGVMGTKRFKFDVWSTDVRMANLIESVSTPGHVLISKSTYSCLSGSYVTELATPQLSEPKLANTELYYVTGQKTRAQSVGLSGLEWKKKINSIDTVCKPEEPYKDMKSKRESLVSIKNTTQLLCPCWKRKCTSPPTKRSLGASSSIMDIQTRLQRCTSYAELAVPHEGEEEKLNVDIDEDIVAYMKEQKVDFDTYFDSQLQPLSLHFRDPEWESTYRNYGRDLDDGSNGQLMELELGYRITKLSYILDTSALFINFLVIMIGTAVCLQSDNSFDGIWYAWLPIFLFGLVVELIVLLFVFAVFYPRWFPKRFTRFETVVINWYVRSVVAMFFIYYPMTMVGISISQCQNSDTPQSHLARLAHVQMTLYVTIVVLVSSMTFMEVSHIVKFVGGLLSALFAVAMILVLNLTTCINKIPNPVFTTMKPVITPTFEAATRPPVLDTPLSTYFMIYYTRHVAPEAVILLLLILILLAIVNRMSEVSVRLSFIGRIEASARRRFTRQRKDQAEWLLFNIIPPHVAYKLRTTGKFSQNHECVGVMFASIVNFQQFLHKDENKGEDSLRLLNVIISEFDTLLERERFASIEKIKTIGSTYMAASGLNVPPEECHSVTHLLDLIDFGHQLVEVLKMMNSKVSDFVFELQIGFNYGSVTSGVVGCRKMLYDIWGDTVNVASRMATTGAVNKIQMPKTCLERLDPYVKTDAVRKAINIKGKGEMRTVFIRPSSFDRHRLQLGICNN